MPTKSQGLPRELADRFTRPFARFLKIESASGLMLLATTMAAIGFSNSALSVPFAELWEIPLGLRLGSVEHVRSLRHWINDGLMTLFFFVVALELKRELVRGELRSLRAAAFSLAGALGGMLAPAFVYLALIRDQPGIQGWGTLMATDTAFVIGGLALLGARVPVMLRLFLLSLAIFDDVGAILVVALGYGRSPSWSALAVAAALLATVAALARIGIRSTPAYCILGIGVWFAFDASGIHPTIAGIALGLMTPAREWVSDARLHTLFERVLTYPKGHRPEGDIAGKADLRRAGVAAREAVSPVERLEMALHPWSGFAIMPLFALCNAGMRLSSTDFGKPVALATFAGLAIGKPIGVLGLSWLASASPRGRRG